MIKQTIISLHWRAILGIVLVLGIVSAISYYTLSLGASFSGLVLCSLLWYRTHPDVWWYDLLFFVVVSAVAIASTVVTLITCQILALLNWTTELCAKMPADRIAASVWSLLLFSTILVWGITRLYIWMQSRNQKST